MTRKKLWLGLSLLTLISSLTTAEAAYTISNGKFVNADFVAEFSADRHYAKGQEALNCGDYREATRQFIILTKNFPNSPFGQEGYYYLGIAEYHCFEYDFANEAMTQYLKCQSNPQNFLSAIEYKFRIAEQLRCGARRRFCGTKQLPRWATGKTLALKIYDEVVSSMPSSPLAAQALYSKGCLLWSMGEHRDCIDAYQLLCRRFPKLELTPQCYLLISQVYCDMCRNEPQNPDILDFAELNARKFRQEFPGEPAVADAEYNVKVIKELYAGGLYDTGCFYEKVHQERAAIIYYRSAIKQFPDTDIAEMCRCRMSIIDPEICEDVEA